MTCLKNITALTALLAFNGIFSVSAQNLDKSFYTVKSDTVVIKKGTGKSLIAANVEPPKPKYKHVPFAIDTAYFGNKVEYITGYTEKYLKSHHKTITTVQDRSKKLFPLIDNVMDQNEIPKELKYLAVIESALNNEARSPVGAVGPWQFMSYTGKEMGLVVNNKRDDRKDWMRSTNAAAKYMMKLYEELDDWLLVIAAYNCGPTPVLRAIQKTDSRNFWDIKSLLPKETQGHVLAFVATATIFEKLEHYIGTELPEEISFMKPSAGSPVADKPKPKPRFTEEELKSMAIVRISEPLYPELLQQELGMDIKLLYKWNFDYELFEYKTYSEKMYNLRIPKEKLDQFVARKEYLEKRSKQIYMSQNI